MGKSLASQKGKKCKTKTKSYVICYLRALGFFGNYEKKIEKMLTQLTGGEAVKSGVHNY